jgi:hypothetical protein
MIKKWPILLGSCLSLVMISGVALSANPIQLIVNGSAISTEVPPQIIDGNTMVPIRSAAEALGAKVDWNGAEQKVTIDTSNTQKLERQIQLLRSWISPQSAEEAVQTWAKAVKSRNGAVQYTVLSPALQNASLKSYDDLNWVTGVSSPWVDSFTISNPIKVNDTKQTFDIAFKLKTSTGDAGGGTVTATVEQIENQWQITGLQGSDAEQLNGIVIIPAP